MNARLIILSTTSWGVLSGRAALSRRKTCVISAAETRASACQSAGKGAPCCAQNTSILEG